MFFIEETLHLFPPNHDNNKQMSLKEFENDLEKKNFIFVTIHKNQILQGCFYLF